jgi:hypothetical protein
MPVDCYGLREPISICRREALLRPLPRHARQRRIDAGEERRVGSGNAALNELQQRDARTAGLGGPEVLRSVLAPAPHRQLVIGATQNRIERSRLDRQGRSLRITPRAAVELPGRPRFDPVIGVLRKPGRISGGLERMDTMIWGLKTRIAHTTSLRIESRGQWPKVSSAVFEYPKSKALVKN